MDKMVYMCTGTCGAVISEEEYERGITKCGAQGCTHEGHEFEMRYVCSVCGQQYKEGENHEHVTQ